MKEFWERIMKNSKRGAGVDWKTVPVVLQKIYPINMTLGSVMVRRHIFKCIKCL